MTNKKYIGVFYLFAFLACICFISSSCTYDYFEDESNYVIYVPKADKNKRTDTYKVDDVSIFIYNTELEQFRYSALPFEDNARTRVGNFHFRLLPGTHPIYALSNTSSVRFSDVNSYNTARFDLEKYEDKDKQYYKEPSKILIESWSQIFNVPGPSITDTALFETKYVGCIRVVFKNLINVHPNLTYDNIKRIQIVAQNVGVTQYFEQLGTIENTRSHRNTPDDEMLLMSTLSRINYKDYEFGFENLYFPSPDLGEGSDMPITLSLTFLDVNNNEILKDFPIDARNKAGEVVVLHMNETITIEVNGNDVQILDLDPNGPLDWDQIVVGGGNHVEM